MSDEIQDGAEEVAVDYSTMTEKQLAAKQEITEGRIAELRLKAEAGDAVPADSAEFADLKGQLQDIKAARASLSAMLIDDIVEAPEAEAAPVEPAPAVEPVAEAVVEEEPVVEEVPELVAADISPAVAQGTGVVEGVEPEAPVKEAPAIFASLDGAKGPEATRTEATDMQTISEKLRKTFQIMRGGAGDQLGQHIMRTERPSQTGAMTLKGGGSDEAIAWNTALIHKKLDGAEAVMADCRNPIELETFENCSYRTDTPFWDIFSQTVDANACSFKWQRNYNLEDIADAVNIWDACLQAGVDPADNTTWKQIVDMPACDEDCYSTAEAFYLTAGLRVSVDDQFCRPDRIREANDLISAYRAIELDNIARAYFDAHAARGGNVKLANLESLESTPETRVGLLPSLQIAIAKVLIQFTKRGRYTCDESGRFAEVPEYLIGHVAIDMGLAGENGNLAEQAIRDAFATHGITDVRFTQDWGCEGDLAVTDGSDDPADAKLPCFDWNCTDQPYNPGILDDCPAFGTGTDAPGLPTRARIRIGHRDAFLKGSTNVVDYDIRQGPDDYQMNMARYFGESRHFFFPRGDLESCILDIDAICPNGNRVDRTGAIACAVL